ncbi:MAG: hypothetical protein AAGM22_31735 [Acidobacteriota bacterium]
MTPHRSARRTVAQSMILGLSLLFLAPSTATAQPAEDAPALEFRGTLAGDQAPESLRVRSFYLGLYKIKEHDEKAYHDLLRFKLSLMPDSEEVQILTRSLEQAHRLSNTRRNEASKAKGLRDARRHQEIQRNAMSRYVYQLGTLYGGMTEELGSRGLDTLKLRDFMLELSKGTSVSFTEPEDEDVIRANDEKFHQGRQSPDRSLFADLPREIQ